jgi:ABC-type transport system involved in cytochrome c biogenesis permease subunit
VFSLTTQPLARQSAPNPQSEIPLAATALNLPSSAPRGLQRTLADLDRAQMTVLQLAFWTLGVGILLGAWWADHSWGRWWAFDPKETWALITWIIYLIVVHVRVGAAGHNRALITAWLSVLGFIVMLWTYFGVNLLLPGLHAYA